jgi:hypothetical protein
MLKTWTRIVLLLGMVAGSQIATPSRVDAQEPSHLKGLTSVAVHVETLGVYPTSSTVRLESDVEERLRQAGIAIGPREAPRTYGTKGSLWVTTTVLSTNRPGDQPTGLVLQTQLRVYGSVVLAGSNERTEAITWERARIEVVPAAEINTRFLFALNYLVDDFSKAFLSVNPK